MSESKVKAASQEVPACKEEFGEQGFEAYLCSIAVSVFENVMAVRAGKMKPAEAAESDDALVRTLARILMNEDERCDVCLPLKGIALLDALKANEAALFAKTPADIDPANPRAMMVVAVRSYLAAVYAFLRRTLADETLAPERLGAEVEKFAAFWSRRLMGGLPERFNN